jgi:hypothetical protein
MMMSKSNRLRESTYKILENNKNIPWVEMWEIDIAESYLKQAQKLERHAKSHKHK